MAVLKAGQQIATFPDTISALDVATGLPLKSGDLHEGSEVAVLHVPYQKLPLGAGVLDRAAYPELEEITGLSFLEFLP